MPRIRDVLAALEEIAPRRYAFDFDRVGLQVGDADAEVTKAVVSLDRSLGALEFAEGRGAQLLLSHHPLIWDPLKTLDECRHAERTAMRLIRSGIGFIAAHTNWDSARGGINDCLADRLELKEVQPFGSAAAVDILKLVVFAPADSVDRIIDALSEAGAGRIGDYYRCAFLSSGHGTFIGGEGTNPTVGEAGKKEIVPEVRFEMLLPSEKLGKVTQALREAHPYEEPAYDLIRQMPSYEQPLGRMGKLARPMSLAEFSAFADEKLGTQSYSWGEANKRISKVAVVGGAADGEWLSARNAGADVFLTGEVRQNIAVEASESGMPILAAGHYATEHPGCEWLRDRMAAAVPEVDWTLFTPAPGQGGRPITSSDR